MPYKFVVSVLCLALLGLVNCGKTQNQKVQTGQKTVVDEGKKILATEGTATEAMAEPGVYNMTVKYAKIDCAKGITPPETDKKDATLKADCRQDVQKPGKFGCDVQGLSTLSGFMHKDGSFGLSGDVKPSGDVVSGTRNMAGKFSAKDTASGKASETDHFKQKGIEGDCSLSTTFTMKLSNASSLNDQTEKPKAKVSYNVNGSEGTRTFSDVRLGRSEGVLQIGAKGPVDELGNQERFVASVDGDSMMASTVLFSPAGTPILQGPLQNCEYKVASGSKVLAFDCDSLSGSVPLPPR
ncbi:MAG: hypothetical protein V1798_06195 [Pseudomonadota bacterium]